MEPSTESSAASPGQPDAGGSGRAAPAGASQPAGASSPAGSSETPTLASWQGRLLPVMIGMLVGLTLFFFVASLFQIYDLQRRIQESPELEDLKPAMAMLRADGPGTTAASDRGAVTARTQLDYARWNSLMLLEGHVLERRYHQANVLLMSRIWTRYLGFVTGMILALVGAAFILGKLRESETKLDAQGLWKFSVQSASPGLILAVLGTVLMSITIVTHHNIEVNDGPSYAQLWIAPLPGQDRPLPFPDDERGEEGENAPESPEELMKQAEEIQEQQP